MKIKYLLITVLTLFAATATVTAMANLVINKQLLEKLVPLTTSRDVEKLLGPPDACVPASKESQEVATCQWKADPKSNSIINTLNITFEVDHIAVVRAISAQGTFYTIKDGHVIKES